MSTKVWNFLLPGCGTHQLRVEEIGTAGQTAFLDGAMQSQREVLIFSGPDDSLLEVRQQGGQWRLLVNGLVVEDYVPNRRKTGDETLRELRGKPEGSYMICPDIDASTLELNIIRKFRFTVCGQLHEVRVAHFDCIWQVVVDGHLVDRVAHKLVDNSGEARFYVKALDGSGWRLKALVRMLWIPRGKVWHYNLAVAGQDVPMCWSKVAGDVPGVEPALIVVPDDMRRESEEDLLAEEAAQDEHPACGPSAEEALPQGVSRDPATGGYQANIRAKCGKFVFLGEFQTPQEAYQRYLEALPSHCPEKALVPTIPG